MGARARTQSRKPLRMEPIHPLKETRTNHKQSLQVMTPKGPGAGPYGSKVRDPFALEFIFLSFPTADKSAVDKDGNGASNLQNKFATKTRSQGFYKMGAKLDGNTVLTTNSDIKSGTMS